MKKKIGLHLDKNGTFNRNFCNPWQKRFLEYIVWFFHIYHFIISVRGRFSDFVSVELQEKNPVLKLKSSLNTTQTIHRIKEYHRLWRSFNWAFARHTHFYVVCERNSIVFHIYENIRINMEKLEISRKTNAFHFHKSKDQFKLEKKISQNLTYDNDVLRTSQDENNRMKAVFFS